MTRLFGVDPDFGILRLRRIVGSYSAGCIGEFAATGVAAAVANAVYDAVGVRVRSLPILPWKILEGNG